METSPIVGQLTPRRGPAESAAAALRGAWASCRVLAALPANPGWDGRGALPLLAGLACLFHADKILLGPWSPVRLHDVFDSDYFRYKEMAGLLLSGGRFSWFPNYLGGIPAHAWHHSPYYVLCLASTVLPIWAVYDAMVVSLMAAAGWGMFRLLRERFGASPRTALLGGAFFALASQVQPNCIPEAVFNCAFPLFYVWTMDLWELRGRRRDALVPLLGVAALLAVSYPVLTLPYFPPLHAAVALLDVRLRGARGRTLALIAALWSGYALTCLPVLLSLWRYAPEAARRFEAPRPLDLESWLGFVRAFWTQLIASCARTATLGALAAAGAAAASSSRVRRVALLWALLLAASAFFNSDASRLFAGTPLQKMDLGHFVWTLPFASVLLAAIGAEERARAAAGRGTELWIATLSLPLFGLLFASGQVSRPTFELNAAISIAFLLWARGAGPRGRAPLLRAAAAALILLSFRANRAYGDEPENRPYRRALEDRSFLAALKSEEPGPWRIGAVPGIPAETLAGYGWESVDGRGPIMNRRYKEFFRKIVEPQLKDPGRAAFFDSYWYSLYLRNVPDKDVPELNVRLLALANVRYVLSESPLPQLAAVADVRTALCDSGEWALRWKDRLTAAWPWLGRAFGRTFPPRRWYVYVLRDAFPRGFLADRAAVLGSGPAVLAAMADASAADLRSTAFFSATDGDRASLTPWLARAAARTPGEGRSRLVRYAADGLEFEVETARPSLLVVTNNFDAGWKAAVDGVAAPVLRADHAFQAVPLPAAGTHRVTLEFRDPDLGPAWTGAAAGALLILLPPLLLLRRRAEPGVGLP